MSNKTFTIENTVKQETKKTVKQINLALFGHGNVGGTLIDQIIASQKEIQSRKHIKLNIFAIANSKKLLLKSNGVNKDWRITLEEQGVDYDVSDVIKYAKELRLDNLIAVDNTSTNTFLYKYEQFIANGFDLVASNKIANTIGLKFYNSIRIKLKKYDKEFLYETNLGAGLPLIDTIKLLHLSGENITRIRGVFSGTLSYIFNNYSSKNIQFSSILQEAINLGLTEPDPRDDLSGTDVARKLLILARELELFNELEDIKVQNLIPKELLDYTKDEFLKYLHILNNLYLETKQKQEPQHVLRYVGDLHGDLSRNNGAILDVKLISVPTSSPLGALTGSDSIFEIYTESYGNNPIVIQGAGAGASVTARGVFGDILRLSNRL